MKILHLNKIFFIFNFLIILNMFYVQAICSPSDLILSSPDGKIVVEVNSTDEGRIFFNILHDNKNVMPHNKLGIIREDADFSNGLKIAGTSESVLVEDHYQLLHGKKKDVEYKANKKEYHLKNKDELEMDIVFQVSNDGVAFRYYFKGKSKDVKKIDKEITAFQFEEGTLAWIQPMSAAKTGWKSVNPCYEEHYYQDIDIKRLPQHEPGWVFPALFKSGDYWIALSETAPDYNYCGCRLLHDSATSIFTIGFPQSAEYINNGPVNPESKLPWATPWRIIVLGDNLGTIAESTLGTDLAKPSMISDVSYIKPGRSSWSWVLYKDDSTIYDVQKRFIDYSAEMGWEYCLVDADWDKKIGYEKLGELCAYAKNKNVNILAWYNSAGDWNTTPYSPRGKLLTKEMREQEFQKVKDLGISGLKIDFFGGDGQSNMQYYQDIFEDAARFKLMVNCHGSTLPRGWQRTYPNLMTMESIKGFEYVTFQQINADLEAGHSTILPFTRNLFDPMDFTPICFSEVPRIERKTTNTFELALSVIFLSGIQHFAEVPEGMAKVPEEVKTFMSKVPVAWDETRFVDGYPGKYAVIARRKDNTWYVAGINGEKTKKDIMINLNFIEHTKGKLFTDADSRTFKIEEIKLTGNKALNVTLISQGGFVFCIGE